MSLLTVTVLRVFRFQQLLRFAELAPKDVQRVCEQLGRRLGLSTCPQVWLVPGRISPMLWALGRRARVLFPVELMETLEDDRREMLLLHELSHYRRGDHWVRILELVGTALYWWHPVVWWARREIQTAEEECCDTWVVAELPQRRETYAAALVDAIGFISEPRAILPPAASGIGNFDSLKRRVTMIMVGNGAKRLSRRARFLVASLALTLLSLWPTFGSDEPQLSDVDVAAQDDARDVSAKSTEDDAKDIAPSADTKNDKSGQATAGSLELTTLGEPTEFDSKPTTLTYTLPRIMAVAISPDGKLLATGSGNEGEPGELVIWDLSTHEMMRVLKYPSRVRDIAFSPNGKVMAVAFYNRLVRLIETATGKVVTELPHDHPVQTLAFSSDGTLLATGSGFQPELKLWEVATGRRLQTLKGHTDAVFAVAVSPDGKTIASGGRDSSIRLWGVQTGKEKMKIDGHLQPVESIAFSPDGASLATASWDKTIKLWDLSTGEVKKTLEGHTAAIYSIAFSRNGKMLASAGQDKSVRLWDVASGESKVTITGHGGRVFDVAFAPDGRSVASAGDDNTARLWDVTDGKELALFQRPADFSDEPAAVLAMAYSPDGALIATAHDDKSVRVRNATTGAIVAVLADHDDIVSCVAFAPDGKTLATGGYDKSVKIWDVATGKEIMELTGHTNWVFGIAFLPNGKVLASGGYDKTVRLWDIATGKQLAKLDGHSAAVRSIAVSPDGRLLASGSSDRTIAIWKVSFVEPAGDKPNKKLALTTVVAKKLLIYKGHTGSVRAVAFSPDGQTLASASVTRSTCGMLQKLLTCQSKKWPL